MRRVLKIALCTLGLAAPLGIASQAQASIADCGRIRVEADASCEVKLGIECMADCQPIQVEAQCSADLSFECRGSCEGSLSVDVECSGSCEASCMSECSVEPGSFECEGSCYGDCEASAMARCGSGDSQCIASGQASCETECQVSCDLVPATAECSAQCEGSCTGSCSANADAYVSCQAECRGPKFDGCEASVTGGCEAACETSEGALFCDGNYVDHDGNLASCVDSLRAALNIMVSGYAEASCEGNSCEAEAGFDCSCTASPMDTKGNMAIFAVGGLMLFGIGRRRRRRAA